MAVEMQSNFILPAKFEKLKFSSYVSVDSMSSPSTPDTPLSPPPEPYEIKLVTKDVSDKLLVHLRQFFFRDEPLNVNIKLLENQETCPDLEEYSLKAIKENLSLMAITESGKIIGVTLNGVIRKGIEKQGTEITDKKFLKIVGLLEYLEENAGVFEAYPDCDKQVVVEVLSVDSTWRGQGIAKKLMNKTRDLAREQGFKLMRADCTSHYTAKALARLGFECIYTLKYEDYKVNGKPVFDPPPPHTEVTVYTQKL